MTKHSPPNPKHQRPVLPVVFVAANGGVPPSYRTFVDYRWDWTPDIDKAIWYARRVDCENLHAEDEDAIFIHEHRPTTMAQAMPVVLAAPEGSGVAPQVTSAADLEHLKRLRTKQYLNDRDDALRSMSVHEWIKFALRWGLAPPPQGFEDHKTLRIVMHKVRLCLTGTTHEQAMESALFLSANNIKLPGSMALIDGVLTGDPNAKIQ
jgi:hypothetical protein